MFIKIKALKTIFRHGLPLVQEGMQAEMIKSLADECVESGEAEYVNQNRKPVDLKKMLAPKEVKK